MKHKFVLDVNTIIFAQENSNAKGKTDFAPATLVYLIAQNCHKIVCDKSLRKQYLACLRDDRFEKLLKHLLFNSEKCEFKEYLPNYAFEKKLPPDDVQIVKLAVFANAVFITSDGRLKTKIQELKIPENHGLKIKSASEALSMVQTRNPL